MIAHSTLSPLGTSVLVWAIFGVLVAIAVVGLIRMTVDRFWVLAPDRVSFALDALFHFLLYMLLGLLCSAVVNL